MGQSYR